MVQRTNSSWSEKEKDFDKLREEFLSSVDLRDYVDHPHVLAKRQSVSSHLVRYNLFNLILDIKGSVVECGVHKGDSLMLYYHLSSILEPTAFNRKIYGFDTFEGFRSISPKDSGGLDEKMFSDTSCDVLRKAVELHDMNRFVGHLPKCELIKGDATVTIPEFKKQHPELIIALLYLDFDIYSPTKVGIEELLPLVPRGGVVAFDELNCAKWKGETEAFKEMINLKDIKLRKFHFDPWVSYFIVGE